MSSHEDDRIDDDLVTSAVAGDVRAFEALLGRHQGKVLRVLRLLGVRADDVQDAAQEVFLRAFRGLPRFHRGKPFGAWIYRITVNTAHDHRARARSGGFAEDLSAVAGEAAPSELEASRLRGRLVAALATLTERERAVFVLREVEGLEAREIAAALGVTSITVRRHLGLARRRLRGALGSDEKKGSED